MSGDIFDTLREKRFAEVEVCPESLRGTTIKLKPIDGDCIEVPAEVACVAERVKQLALAKGADAEISLTLKKATLSKVVEYMKYHEMTPPGDIVVPLVSEKLEDSGATKWDASFVNVDKNALYDLMYAANAMHIPTLTYLTACKATALLMNKSSEEIRKEVGVKNDLPVREEADIKQSFEELSTKRGVEPTDAGLAPSVAMMHGVLSAAARQGALEPAAEGEPPAPRRESLNSWRLVSWRTAIFEDWTQLAKAPDDVCGDRELMFAAVIASRGRALQYATDALKADRQLVLHAAEVSGESLLEAAAELRGDRQFVLEACAKMGTATAGASDALRGDRSFILTAVSRGGGVALKGALEALREDGSFVLECAAIAPEAVLHAGEVLKQSRDFALAASTTIPGALQFLTAKFRADREIVDAAVKFDANSVMAAHASRREELAAPQAAIASREQAQENQGPRLVGVPNTLEAQEAGMWYMTHKLQKYVVFTAMSTITANMGQSNYIAANSMLDKIPPYERPEIEAVGLMWGTVGGMGMRWKAFASMDFMNNAPDLLMGVADAAKVLHVVTTRLETPEWLGAQYMDPAARQSITDGMTKTGGYKPSEVAPAPAGFLGPMGPVSGRRAEAFGAGACGRDVAEKTEGEGAERRKFAWRPDPNAPLANWPGMTGTEEEPIVTTAPVDREMVLELAREPREITEGSKVLLTGLNSKSGLTGTVVTCYPEGRYRVALDQKKGFALLRAEYLEVLDYVEQ